ncbi:hypothetical protein SAMN06264364_1456 [Quadrisphaera granulorum]|uniref:Uncharacterized protein n=1 Tax=Quadrisphaera granulorum TaxID=317664 RepID=A0A315ZMQ5_9ACTN|nr:hypothetical protein [Quadrisphaera granulorum]PWJ46851.1 hypothetical protein BXY45_1456 [Quadrisphaera granulorum]SZE99018.1 hypothetical protein SAMN06264364_1456 [Quadrisphaera granulorum]
MRWTEPTAPYDVARAITDDVQAFWPEVGNGPGPLPGWCRAYLGPEVLIVVVLPGQARECAEQALAHGLHHSDKAGVPLVMAVPEAAAGEHTAAAAVADRVSPLQPGRVSVWSYGATVAPATDHCVDPVDLVDLRALPMPRITAQAWTFPGPRVLTVASMDELAAAPGMAAGCGSPSSS